MNQPIAVRGREIAIPPIDYAWLALADEEPALERDLAIVDSHHHLFDRLGARYLVPDLDADIAQSGHNVVATVFVEGGNFYFRNDGPDHLKPAGETEVIASMSAAHRNLCNGIVGYADFFAGPAAGELLDAHIAAGHGRFVGIRQFAMWDDHEDVKFHSPAWHRPLSRGMLTDGKFREGFAELGRRGLVFDCSVFHHQLPEVADLARAFPDTTIVLDHIGCVVRVGPYADKRDEVFAVWKAYLKALAQQPNVLVKIGGLGMQYCGFEFRRRPKPPNSRELAETWKPFVETVLDTFGPDRSMLESNFPAEKSYFTYGACWNGFKRLTAAMSPSEKRALYSGTAARAYGLKL